MRDRRPNSPPVNSSVNDRIDALYRLHHRRLAGLASSITLDRGAADEVVQDAFAGLAKRFEHVENPEGYLQRSVINLAIRVVKRRGRRLPVWPIDQPTTPEVDETWAVVAQLPPQQRAVLALRFWEDLTQAQIAEVLDIPLGTVKSTLHRALTAVKTHLDTTNSDLKRRNSERPRTTRTRTRPTSQGDV